MDLIADLLARVDRFCQRTGMSKARLATIVVNDGKFFDRIAAGGSTTVKTYERFVAWLAEAERGLAGAAVAGEAGSDQDGEPAPAEEAAV